MGMKGFWKCALAVLMAMALTAGLVVGGRLACPSYAPVPLEAESRGIGVRPLVPYETHYNVEATADHWAVLVDLSDNPGYPHANTNSIVLKAMRYTGDLSAAEEWHWYVGVVVGAPTVTDTDIIWITGGPKVEAVQFDERWPLPEHGLNLLVDDDETLMFVLSNELTTTTAITSTQLLPSPHSSLSGTVGVGDLILFLDEITGTAGLHFAADTSYNTE